MGEYDWCRFEASSPSTIIVEVVAQCMLPFYWIALAFSLFKHHRQSTLDKFQVTYLLLTLYLGCFSIKTALNLAAYSLYIGSPQIAVQSTTRTFSVIFGMFDFLTTFCLHSIMLDIGIKWVRNMMRQLKEVEAKDRKWVDKMFRFVWIIGEGYWRFRLIYVLYYIVSAVLALFWIVSDAFRKIDISLSIFESIVIFITYVFGLLTLKKLRSHFPKLPTSLLFEYTSLTVVCLLRMVINITANFTDFSSLKFDRNCRDVSSESNEMAFTILLSLGLLLMHAVPATIIFYSYWPARRESKIQSLVEETSDAKLDDD